MARENDRPIAPCGGAAADVCYRQGAEARAVARDRRRNVKLQRTIFIVGMLSVAMLHFAIFYVYVNLNSILMAFQSFDIDGGLTWGFSQFQVMFAEFARPGSIMLQALANTMIFFAVNMLVKIPLTFLFSYFLYKKIWGYKFYRFVFYLPSIISAVVLTTLVKNMVGPNGPIPMIYSKLMGKPAPLFLANSAYALNVILLYGIWAGFGVNIILFNGAMSRVPEEVVESGRLEGLGMFREMWSIIIPLTWPTVSTVIILAFVGIFTSSGEILLFTKGDYGTYTIAYWIFTLVQGVNGIKNFEYASAIGLFFSVVAIPIVFTVKWLLEKVNENVEY